MLVTFIKVLPEVGSLPDGLGLWRHIFTEHTMPGSLNALLPFVDLSITTKQIAFGLCILFTIILFIVSLIQRKAPARCYFNKLPAPLRIMLLVLTVFLLASFGVRSSWGKEAFMYANF